ncbi:MAG: A/G-specific adenine glycosylase [Chloroflexi bacterium]|nr:A/G-specific adenine glycosylase [Chloroflexota bacterium]
MQRKRTLIKQKPKIGDALLRWYSRHARAMPWRGSKNPYHVWISEIMLQQTQVDTVIPYYRRWLKRFPSVKKLAKAKLHDVLQMWQGLGYYSRARNLHAASQKVLREFNGDVPNDLERLRTLPGVGRYTAGAILSIAFNGDAAVVDGNVKRVLSRLFNLRYDVKSSQGEKKLWSLAESLVPSGKAGDYNQALMDLGATICKPQNPLCGKCPLKKICEAKKLGVQESRPVAKKKKPTPHYDVTAGIVRKNGRVLIAQRPADKLLGGMWEFPGGKMEKGETKEMCLRRELKEELGIEVKVGKPVMTLRHAYSHFKITLYVFESKLIKGKPRAIEVADFKWLPPRALAAYPMGKTDRIIAESLNKNERR